MLLRQSLIAALFVLPSLLHAQKPIEITETEKEMSMGTKHCYVMNIPQAKAKNVIDDWKKYVKKDSKGKIEENNGEIKLIGAVYKNISSLPFNVFAKALETADGTQLTGWFSEGEIFIASTTAADKSTAVQKYMHDFGVMAYKEAVSIELDNENNKLKDLSKIFDGFVRDQKGAESNIASYNKEIEKMQAKIKEEQAKIGKATDSQSKGKGDVDTQQAVIKQVNDKLNNIK